MISASLYTGDDVTGGHYIAIRFSKRHQCWFVLNDNSLTSFRNLSDTLLYVKDTLGGSYRPYLVFYQRERNIWTNAACIKSVSNPIDTPRIARKKQLNPFNTATIIPTEVTKAGTSLFNQKVKYDIAEAREVHSKLQDRPQPRLYTCSVCLKQFTKKWSLDRHFKNHTNERVECSLCDKKFSRKDMLLAHMYTHMRIRCIPFRKCQNLAYSSEDLYKHNQKVHGNQEDHNVNYQGNVTKWVVFMKKQVK